MTQNISDKSMNTLTKTEYELFNSVVKLMHGINHTPKALQLIEVAILRDVSKFQVDYKASERSNAGQALNYVDDMIEKHIPEHKMEDTHRMTNLNALIGNLEDLNYRYSN